MNYLNHLIAYQKNPRLQKDGNHPSHIWLVYINEHDSIDAGKLSSIFKNTPLRLDSYVFAFFETDKGECILCHYHKAILAYF